MGIRDLLSILGLPLTSGILILIFLGLWFLLKEIITFFRTEVLPYYYRQELKKKSIILAEGDKVLDIDWKDATFFRETGPKFVDFQKGYVFIRREVELIRSKLVKGRFVHIEGAPSSGKTVIALSIAYQILREKKTVFYFNRPSSVSEDFRHFMLSPLGEKFDKQDNLLILDNVHLGLARSTELFAFIYNNLNHIRVLFISRPILNEHIPEDVEMGQFDFTSFMPKFEITADSAIRTIANFYSEKRFGQPMSQLNFNAFVNECAYDLLILGRYLKQWDGSPRLNIEQLRHQVGNSIREDLEKLRRFSPDAVLSLFILCIFYKFEIRVEKPFFDHLGYDIDPLIKNGEIKEENGYVFLYHSSLARLYSNTIQSLNMPEFSETIKRFEPFPVSIFSEYIQFEPRNVCELLINLRRTPDLLESIINSKSLIEHIQRGLERENSLGMLAFTIYIMTLTDRWALLKIIESVDLRPNSSTLLNNADPSQIYYFINSIYRISKEKGRMWLVSIDAHSLTRKIVDLKIKSFAKTLDRIRNMSPNYFDSMKNHLDFSIILERFLEEEDIESLRIGLDIIFSLLKDRIDIRVSPSMDFTGEWATKVTLYFETRKATRYLKGKKSEFSYARSHTQRHKYRNWLVDHRKKDCHIRLDEGATIAFTYSRNRSLFPVGITEVVGEFKAYDIIEIRGEDKKLIGVGVSNYNAAELQAVKRLRTDDIIKSFPNIPANKVFENDLTVHLGKDYH
jgi:hypothetical protein